MKKGLLLLAGLLLNVAFSNGQVLRIDDLQDFVTQSNINRTQLTSEKIVNEKNLIGSPYLDGDEFKAGKIYDIEKNKIINGFIRYRIFDDIMQVKKELNTTEPFLIKRSNNYKVFIEKSEFIFVEKLPIELRGTNNGYVKISYKNPTNNLMLLTRWIQEYTPEKKPTNNYSSGTNAKLNTSKFYFISLDEKIYAIEAHKKRAADAFPDHNKELEKYIKENKLKFRGDDEEKDLITLIKYYNEVTQDS